MNSRAPKYSYILAVIAGLVAFLISAMGPLLFAIVLVFFLAGGLFGFIWPKVSWHWGLWIAGPMVFFLALSVLFAGQLDIFFKKDLPALLLALISACLGSFILSRYKRTRKSM